MLLALVLVMIVFASNISSQTNQYKHDWNNEISRSKACKKEEHKPIYSSSANQEITSTLQLLLSESFDVGEETSP